jgi:PAS domain S-box-containing protein
MSIFPQNSIPISLLCVDDDVGILDTLELYFNHEPDIAVQTSSSAIDALNLLNSQHFDAIICDYSMPDMDGIALLREIRSRGDNAIFITLTGRRLTQVAIDTLNCGGNYYMQKGVNIMHDLQKLAGLIRHQRNSKQATPLSPQADNPYQLYIDNQFVPLCCFDRNGQFRYTNRSYNQDIGKNESGDEGFFSAIPDDERDELISHLTSLTVLKPSTHILHHIRSHDGSLKLFLGNYRVITGDSGEITGYTALGSHLSGIVCLSSLELHSMEEPKNKPEPIIKKFSLPEPEGPVSVKKKKRIKDYFAELAGSVEQVPYPVFAIDRAGKVIVWNKAMAELTGVEAAEVYGEGGHAYAVVIYSDKRPMLIDYICDQQGEEGLKKTLGITRDGDVFSRDLETVEIRGKPMLLWSKGAGIYDTEGSMIAAVQSILVSSEQPDKNGNAITDKEVYIGGISSIILKVTGRGMGGAIAGAIGSAVGGYGVYATNQRLFVIHNPYLDPTRNDSIQFGTFILGELFGTNVDTRPLSLDELERHKVYEVWRKDITRIELKKPLILAGSLIINTISGATFRVYIDHTKAFTHLDHLLKLFYPEILRIE